MLKISIPVLFPVKAKYSKSIKFNHTNKLLTRTKNILLKKKSDFGIAKKRPIAKNNTATILKANKIEMSNRKPKINAIII